MGGALLSLVIYSGFYSRVSMHDYPSLSNPDPLFVPPEIAFQPTNSSTPPQRTWDPYLVLSVMGIWIIGLVMRLWKLGEFDAPVFDEVYFPKFAQSYLDNLTLYDIHPPLGKYLILLGIGFLGRDEFGLRIMTAFFGSLVPVLVAGVAYRLSRWPLFAVMAGSLMLTDGLFLVESRYGLMNVFLVAFGFAAQIYLIAGLERQGASRAWLLTLSGVMLGAAVSVKWNGLWFSFMFAGLGLIVWMMAGYYKLFWLFGGFMALVTLGSSIAQQINIENGLALVGLKPAWIVLSLILIGLGVLVRAFPQVWARNLPRIGILAEIRHLQWWHYGLCYILVMAILYGIQWIPHLLQNPVTPDLKVGGLTFWKNLALSIVEINKSILGGHTGDNLTVTYKSPFQTDVHPYCSTSWLALATALPSLKPFLSQGLFEAGAWSWPVLARPIGYYFSSEGDIWRAVQALGNPLLWWLSLGSLIYLTFKGICKFQGIPAYLLLGFAANYLPWFTVGRCVFLYHYMSALAFAIMALAWVISCLLSQWQRSARAWGLTLLMLVLASQIYFTPLWYGFPIKSSDFYLRMWFRPNPIPFFCWGQSCETSKIKIPAIPGFNWI